MTELGNELVNGILEAKVDSTNSKKPTPQSTRYNKLQNIGVLLVIIFVKNCDLEKC